jgi:Flp pilus assembly protein TadD
MAVAAPRRSTMLVAAALFALVAAIYGQVRGHAFVDFDDGEYVYENPTVREGLTAHGVAWAFTTTHAANWHPLTWLSHMLDVELFGLDPGWHHVVAALLHSLNAVLLFLVLRSATGAPWRSAFVAALFAAHPLHVESVAWVAERKDVLSATFFLLTIGAYVRYARAPGAGRYAVVASMLALGLLAKPMLVTVPFVLLLADVWPLGRHRRDPWKRLLVEKLPLLALAVASSVVTLVAQSSKAATASAEAFPIPIRIANAVASCVEYLEKAAWPSGLAVFYPHPASLGESVPALRVAVAGAVLASATALAVWQARRRPYLLVGWLWFLGTLVPVIGIVQVGAQAMADRYTYIPLLGIFLAIAWGAGEVAERWPGARPALAATGAGVVAALAAAAYVQAGTWRDARSLYSHAIAVTRRNFVAWNNLGMDHLRRRELPEARASFEQAIRAKPDCAMAHYNLGVTLGDLGDVPAAMGEYLETIRLDPAYVEAWVNAGILYRRTGDVPAAISFHLGALRLRPDDAVALEDLALAYAQMGNRARAAEALRSLRHVDPGRAEEIAPAIVQLAR